MAKNVWLKDDTESLLLKARQKFIEESPTLKPYDNSVIKTALGVYLQCPKSKN